MSFTEIKVKFPVSISNSKHWFVKLYFTNRWMQQILLHSTRGSWIGTTWCENNALWENQGDPDQARVLLPALVKTFLLFSAWQMLSILGSSLNLLAMLRTSLLLAVKWKMSHLLPAPFRVALPMDLFGLMTPSTKGHFAWVSRTMTVYCLLDTTHSKGFCHGSTIRSELQYITHQSAHHMNFSHIP